LVALAWAASGVPESIQLGKTSVVFEIRSLRFARESRYEQCATIYRQMSTCRLMFGY
jgi:hypothetical protein